ncbi:hypothetical protein [Nocardia sp. alder85J]|uniref:hypothetical protein n=1 Tax=Nocardia sp. alder85J TaxID=2862949 RepID=UPI001CD40C52|nr:hypothetical protein [Nocardia sp. alder85J]MCX4094176.1 hypothetical protein [Nocardia sp. alder85J]
MTDSPFPDPGRPRGWRRHRPLLWLAAAMAGLVIVSLIGTVVDHRMLTGLPIWDKSVKFALSVAIYAVTWVWLLAGPIRRPRSAWWAGTIAAGALAVEMVIIVTQIVRGTTSHFNNTTPFDRILFDIMGFSIVVVWVATLVASLAVVAAPAADPARAAAVRWGTALSLTGMAVGFLMFLPARGAPRPRSIGGAHTVGAPDGGPGLPFLGWSTAHGDLRIPHFAGIHALQLVPLTLAALELAAAQVPTLRSVAVRARLVTVAGTSYAAVLALLTWQAMRGQSIVRPDRWTLVAGLLVAVVAAAAAVLALRGRRSTAGTAVALEVSR